MTKVQPKQLSSSFLKTERLYRFLKSGIQTGKFPNGARLPTVRELAGAFHLSAGTVHKCLVALEQANLASRKGRSGVYVRSRFHPQPGDETRDLEPATGRAEKIAGSIIREISNGNLKVGEYLPDRKALRYQFRTSYPTLKNAFAILEKRNLLRRKGNAFVIGALGIRQPRSVQKVHVLAARSVRDGRLIYAPVSNSFLVPFERELGNLGIRLFWRYVRDRKGLPQPLTRKAAMGYMYAVGRPDWMEQVVSNSEQVLHRELKRLTRVGSPVVLFNCATILARFESFSFRPYANIYPFALNNQRAGEMVGHHLGLQGHENVAYFSHSSEAWNTLRFLGLAKAWKELWGKKGVVHENAAQVDKVSLRGSSLGSKEIKARIGKLISHVFKGYKLNRLSPTARIMAELVNVMTADHHRTVLWPFFQRALRNPEITAWACADPTVALSAVEYLHQRDVAVPGRISLIACDDHQRLLDRGISGYDAQVERMGYLGAHCILGDIPVTKDRLGVVECPGRIVDRGSVARA